MRHRLYLIRELVDVYTISRGVDQHATFGAVSALSAEGRTRCSGRGNQYGSAWVGEKYFSPG
jgi:hypothetical protein